MMQEFLMTLLQAVLTAAVPILTGFAVTLLRAKTREATERMESDRVKMYMTEASEAVATAVTYTSQTYVDTLKKTGAFTAENQNQAFRLAREKAEALLSESARGFIEMAYGDVMQYLEARIEQEVKRQKDGLLAPTTLELA